MIFRFRAILDAQEDIIRDLEILDSATMEDFHNALVQAFGFDGGEMASFYLSDDQWEQGDEIALFSMGDEARAMADFRVDEVVSDTQNKLIYVYDFLSMWTFLIELAELAEPEDGKHYPNLIFAHGQIPDQAPDKEFIAENPDEGFDSFDDDDFDDFDFEEQWN